MDAFVAAAATTAARLRDDEVQVWQLPYRHGDGRRSMRAVLAACLDVEPEILTFVHGPHGRPRLAPMPAQLDFSWSHSGDCAVLAIARGLPELGVDVERHRPRPRALELAARYFAAEERAALQLLPPAARDAAFLALWTAKEAVLKGVGRGLAYGLDRVAFTVDDELLPHPLRFAGSAAPASDWQLRAMRPRSDVSGAVAWRGSARALRCFTPA